MTHHPTFPTRDIANANIVTFPNTSDASLPDAHVAIDGGRPEGIPDDFTLDHAGVHELRSGDGEDLVSVKICSPIFVKGRCRNAEGSGWGLVLAVQDPNGDWHELVLNGRQLNSSPNAALAPLFDLGFELAPINKAAESVMQLLRSWQPNSQYLRFDRLGWTSNQHDAFVLGNGHVIGDALVTTDSVPEELMSAIHTRGTLEAWSKEVAARCIGNPLMMLAVSHAFTGPLLSVLGQTGGGFHLRGASSRGKSTIQYVASSVWGGTDVAAELGRHSEWLRGTRGRLQRHAAERRGTAQRRSQDGRGYRLHAGQRRGPAQGKVDW
jgi:putative DNA primase/helicase